MRFFLLILLSVSLWGSIGNIAAMKGVAQLKRSNSLVDAKMGMEILEGDEVVTQAKTRVQVLLKDNTVVTIGANSTFSFKEFSMKQNEEKVSMEAKRGFFRSVTGEIGKIAPERFKVKTASATIGIRGTDFSVEILEDKELIKCYSGMITVRFKGGYKEIPAGVMFELKSDGTAGEEVSITPNLPREQTIPTEVISDVTQGVQEYEREGVALEPFTITPNVQPKTPLY